jgi:hypothetical protein
MNGVLMINQSRRNQKTIGNLLKTLREASKSAIQP